VISRIKVLSRMDISERRVPQDGQFTLEPSGGRIHLRASTFPCSQGEKIVLRILRGQSLIPFASLGMSPTLLARVRDLVTKPQGFVVTSGPTGSGKTSTLYSFLQLIDTTAANVVTLEDPIEVELQTITQGQTNVRTGFTFAAGLRAVLRQDPDVILVGEIRDSETAGIALQASLTGHLVMTTLHTSDTVETVVRLVDLGIEPWIIANAVSVVLAQRLVRLTAGLAANRGARRGPHRRRRAPAGRNPCVTPRGCVQCRGTGYRGRTGIFEALEMTDELRDLIKTKASPQMFREVMRRQRIPSLRHVGIDKVRAGITTIDEVLRVT
jgi:general secretion pathway protein E/type IV pilus assembly protein PilB